MNNNIIDFNTVKSTQEQETQLCEHCEVRKDIIESFLYLLHETMEAYDGEKLNNKIIELACEFYDDIYKEGRRFTFKTIADFANYSIDEIDELNQYYITKY